MGEGFHDFVHINTELRVAWRRGLEDGLAKQPEEVVPYRILPAAPSPGPYGPGFAICAGWYK
jgi:hypothetical protein